VQHRFLTGNFV